MGDPFFSIVISVYNRPDEIKNCLVSCLQQSFQDYEVVVVDDASSDATVETVLSFQDPRIRLIRHEINKGMGAARNTGNDATKGTWIVRMDSDFELLPNALEVFYQKIAQLPADVLMIGARFRWDTGNITPAFVPPDDLDYVGRIRWAEAEGGSDFLSCTHRSVFTKVRWFECRGHSNGLFQLDQALYVKGRIFEDILGIQISTAPGSQLRSPTKARWQNRVRSAPSQLEHFQAMLGRHGEALKQYGPRQYRFALQMTAFNAFLTGDRAYGWKCMRQYLAQAPFSLSGWTLALMGFMGPRVMQSGYALRDLFQKDLFNRN